MQELAEALLLTIQNNSEWAWAVVFTIAFVESMAIIGLLMPGWILLVGIGTMIGADVLDFFPIVVAAYFGAVIGEYISFHIGYHYHEPILNWKVVASHKKLIHSTRVFFEKYGAAGVFFGRFIGPVRAVIPLVAGISEMPKKTFFWVNVTSGLIWAPLYLIPGILAGAAVTFEKEISSALFLLVAVIALAAWMAFKQTRLAIKTLTGESDRNRQFAVVNLLLSWSVFLVMIFILITSEYFPIIQEILQLVWSKIIR